MNEKLLEASMQILYLGIGRDVAKALVACGAETFALSRTQADLDSLKQEVLSTIIHVFQFFFSNIKVRP